MSEEPHTATRTVAIVGRPNVGKSALFNRLVGRRVSIVHEESGVTRDRVVCRASWAGSPFDLIDTGGIGMIDEHSSPDQIEQGTRTQVDTAIEDASVLVFVVDIDAGIVPLDQEVARLLHECGRKVICAANKADTAARDPNADEFASLGFPVFPISALHNRGIDDLMTAAMEELPPVEEQEEAKPLRVAIVGRPNVGKSSYINRMLKSDRVIVSNVPGTTRDSIEIPFTFGKGPSAQHYVLVDTAGIKKQGRVKSPVETFSMMRTEKAIESCDVAVLMVDASEGPKARDKRIAGMIMQKEKGCILLVNKWDLAQEEGVTQRAYGKALQEALPFMGYVPTLFASALNGYNIRRTLEAMDYVGTQVRKQLSTGVLNRVIREAFDRVAPPVVGGKLLKFYYAVQVGTAPVRIRLFVNEPKRVRPNYKTYLENALRTAFGLEGAPLVLLFRSRPKVEIYKRDSKTPQKRSRR